MSTPDQPSQPLTRRRLRELKMTGQTPVISTEDVEADKAARADDAPAQASGAPTPPPAPERPAAEPPAAQQAQEAQALASASAESTAPRADDAPRPLTRRAARERLRTNQVPVIPPAEPDTAGAAEAASGEAPDEPNVAAIETVVVGENETSVVYEVVEVPFEQGEGDAEGDGAPDTPQPAEPPAEAPVEKLVYDEPEQPAASDEDVRPEAQFADAPVQTVYVAEDAPSAEDQETEERPTVAPAFGSTLLKAPAEAATAPASFEEILSHSADSSGTTTAASTLILSSDPGTMSLSAPIDATGEVLVTSTHALPDGFGSRGHAAGTTDGKEVDVVLIDGELPLASSPTPIAASDAVSTSKSPAEVIRPPAPEKTHRLTMLLGITAGVLGIALIGVVVAAFTTGVLG